MRFDVYEYTSKGGRSYNEDSLGSYFDGSGGVFVVADGLGGHDRGGDASAAAVKAITTGWDTSSENISEQICEKVEQANSIILELQKQNNTVMKTTAAILAVCGQKAVMANSGDSRVYFIHNNELHSYTKDHSVAFKKYLAGEITREMIAVDEDQSALLRSLGGTDRYKPELYECDTAVVPGDAFMLCSDGTWEYLKDEEILIDFLKSEDAEKWAEMLMIRIMERLNGNNDNLSIMTVIVE